MINKSKRLSILTDDEYKALYNRPAFSTHEREHFFSLSKPEWKLIEKLNFDNSVYFILQMGYFQAKSQFFNVTVKSVFDDIKFITENVLSRQKTVVNFPSRNSRTKIKNMILEFLKYVDSISVAKSECKEKLKTVLQRLHNPSAIFKELLHFLSQKRIMLPAYTTMQEIISNAIVLEENRIKNKMQDGLPKHIIKDLLSLLTIEGDFYKLTDLKHDLRNFNYGQITDEVTKHNTYKKLYYFSKKFIPLLEISIDKINYYASLATYYTVYKLKRMPETLANLYMLCYVFHRHQKMSDNLTQAFNFKVDNYGSDASTEADKVILAEKKQLNVDDEKMGVLIGYYDDACTILTKKIAKLPLFKKYNFLPGINHASIDGSKQGSKRQTAKCRFSPKYFGLTKGVSALSMILHGAPLNTKIIGANEHESHFSFDIYFNNKSDIPIDMISTDTAGSNQLTHLFFDLDDVEYAACYKSVVDTINYLSIYMLKYVDDPLLQRAVRIVLNTGENYNKLYNGVTKIGGKKFRGMSDIEIDIWHQCTRLITLVILYYNIYLLSTLIDQMGDDEEAIKLIMRVSPLALRHINLGGLYYYGNDNKKIDVEGMVAAMKIALEELREKKKKS